MADFSGILNPRRVIDRRISEAEQGPVNTLPPQPSQPAIPFTKPFTPAERAAQNAQLARLLTSRQFPELVQK